VTIKEGMLDETILIMVVDKSATQNLATDLWPKQSGRCEPVQLDKQGKRMDQPTVRDHLGHRRLHVNLVGNFFGAGALAMLTIWSG
jgi:hypothetical protein